jgi:hypothetical protein
MPMGDRTGPWGLGSRSGRGLGYCSGYTYPGFMNPSAGFFFGRGVGRGFGRGLGFGRGRSFWRAGYSRCWGYLSPPVASITYPPYAQDEEGVFLEEQTKILEDQLGQIRERLDELKKQKKES